jgi:hypothetical protein
MKHSTIGWQACCQWKDESTSWENLAGLKESHPLETAEYAVTQGNDHEPARSMTGSYALFPNGLPAISNGPTSLA